MKANVSERPQGQAGFSLVELMVAMVITLIISGSIYGLMAGGQSAFQVQPEHTERQQNIRIAIDLIQRDIAAAGMSMDPFVQTFTSGLNGAGPPGASGQNSDVLEIVGSDGTCPPIVLSPGAPIIGGAVTLQMMAPVPQCFEDPGFVWAVFPAGGALRWGRNLDQDPADADLQADLEAPQPPLSDPLPVGNPTELRVAQVIRYQLAPEDAADPTSLPALFRSVSGGFDDAAVVAPPGGPWQLVARGIDDLQVQYVQGFAGAVPVDDAPDIVAGVAVTPPTAPRPCANLISEVRVTISSRGETANIAGARLSATGAAIRGGIESRTSPRRALFAGSNAESACSDAPAPPAAPPWQ